MTCAPIALFVYNRPWHTQQTIAALQKNELADQSELFIFSDGPKNESDAINVQKVRKYIHTVTGFKKITITEKPDNSGLAKSIISGITEIIEQYGKIIVLEDDLVTSPAFLNFVNDGLDFYKENKEIFCITGYNFPASVMKIPKGYPYEIYFSPRNGSWGWATWKDRWQKADWDVSDYQQFSQDKKMQQEFNYGGEDLFLMLKSQMEGKIDSWSIRWCYNMFKYKGYCVYPIHSFIENIGCDGSGTHYRKNMDDLKKNFVLNQKKNINFPKTIEIDDRIMEQFQNIYRIRKKNLLIRIFQFGRNYVQIISHFREKEF